jgi:hypothetical protein
MCWVEGCVGGGCAVQWVTVGDRVIPIADARCAHLNTTVRLAGAPSSRTVANWT